METTLISQANNYDVSASPSNDRYNKNGRFLGTDFPLGVDGKTAKDIREELKTQGFKGHELKRRTNQVLSSADEQDRRMVGAIAHLYKAKNAGLLPDKAKYSSRGKLTLTTEEFETISNPLNQVRQLGTSELDELIKAAQARKTALDVATIATEDVVDVEPVDLVE